MIEPYKMVFVNTILFTLLSTGVLIYRYIFPKKKLNLFFLFLLYSILPLISIFRIGDYESGDFNIHVYRTIAFYNALLDGQIMPSWPENLNATYGYPLFVFLNALPYYIISIFKFFGFGYINSLKIYLVFTYLASGIFFWLFAKKVFKDSLAVFFASIIYLFTPYHLLDLHFRAAVGELLAFLFLPLLFLVFHKTLYSKRKRVVLIAGAVYGLFLMAHQAIAVFSLILLIPYAFFQHILSGVSLRNIVVKTGMTILLGFILSIYIWLPHITHAPFTYGYLLSGGVVSFPEFWQLFYSPYRYGFLFQGPKGELSFAIGYTQLFIVLVSSFLAIKHFLIVKKKIRRKKHQFTTYYTRIFHAIVSYKSSLLLNIIFWLLIFLLLLFLMTNYSAFLWKSIRILSSAQFSTRLLVIVTFCVAMLSGYLSIFLKNKKRYIYILIFLSITYTMLNWGHRRLIKEIGDLTLVQQLWSSTISGEAFYGLGSPKWVNFSDPWEHEKPKNHLEILSGSATIKFLTRTSISHTYVVHATSRTIFKENTLYFPGWKLFANQNEIKIIPTNPRFPGVITFSLPPGLYFIELRYKDLPFHQAAKAITLIGYILIFVYAFLIPGIHRLLHIRNTRT